MFLDRQLYLIFEIVFVSGIKHPHNIQYPAHTYPLQYSGVIVPLCVKYQRSTFYRFQEACFPSYTEKLQCRRIFSVQNTPPSIASGNHNVLTQMQSNFVVLTWFIMAFKLKMIACPIPLLVIKFTPIDRHTFKLLSALPHSGQMPPE